MLRFQLCVQGLWVQGRGHGRWVPWSRLLVFPLLTLLAGVCFLTLSLAREHPWFKGSLSWLAYAARYPTPSNRIAAGRVREVAWGCFLKNQEAALDDLLHTELPPAHSALPTVQIHVQHDSLRWLLKLARTWDLNQNRPKGRVMGQHDPFVRAYMKDESGKFLKAELGLRGTSNWHHKSDKPSFRVKLKKSSMEQSRGHRTTELSRPEDTLAFQAILSESIARSMGVLSSQSDPVRLLLNGTYRGVYLRHYRPGDELAQMQGRLPGVWFKGDRFDTQAIWNDLTGWQAFGAPSQEQKRLLLELIKTINEWPKNPHPETIARLVDTDAYARWAAVVVHAGSTHVDDCHNQVFYLNPTSGKLQPVIWDLNGYGTQEVPEFEVNASFHKLYRILMQDPEWRHQRNLALYELINGPGSAESVKRLLDRHMAAVEPELRADSGRGELIRLYGRPGIRQDVPLGLRVGLYLWPNTVADIALRRQQLLEWIEIRDRTILGFLQDCRVSVTSPRSLAVHGTVAVLVKQEGKPDRLLHPNLAPPQYRDFTAVFAPAPRTYWFPGGLSGALFYNSVTGARVAPVSMGTASVTPLPETSLHPPGPEDTLVLGPGPVRLDKDLVVSASQRLRILPGTTVRAGAGVGIVSRGPVEAVGTADRPIEFRPADPAQPWGGLALVGPATRGSRLAHLRVQGALPRWFETLHLRGQLTVYGCPQVELESCWFGPSAGGDDAVLMGDSTLEVKDCLWEGVPMDGLDLEKCQGRVTGSSFVRCGNDGLDLSHSDVRVTDCRFEDSGDKGISVGEETRAEVSDCLFSKGRVGVLVKDRSRALVQNSRFVDNALALDCHRKQVFFQTGGEALLRDCQLAGERDLRVDEWSKVWLLGTQARPMVSGADRVQRVSQLPKGWAW